MKTEFLGVRLTQEQVRKLDRLATVAQRGRSDVIRVLIENVDPAALAPNIHIDTRRSERAA